MRVCSSRVVRVAALFSLLVILAPLVLAEPVRWMDYEAALEQAWRARKLVYVYFYSENCPACRMMEKVFHEPRVSDTINAAVLPVRVDVAKHPDIASAFMVPATPAHLFICPNGTPLGGALGYRDVENFIELISLALNEARRKCPSLETLETARELGGERSTLGLSAALIFSLLIGLATPLSPCILPLLPIMYLMASRSGKRGVSLFTFSFFTFSSLLGVVATGFFLAARSLAEPLAYGLLLFAGVALLIDRLGRGLSYIASRVATRLSGSVKHANPFMLGALATIMWGPCAAPMAAAAFSLAAFARNTVETAAISVAFAAGLTFGVYALTLGLRKARSLMGRARTLKKLNRALGLAMVLASILHFAGLY